MTVPPKARRSRRRGRECRGRLFPGHPARSQRSADDVAIATEPDAGAVVPVLTDGAFDHGTGVTASLPNP